ncbi:type II CRISPR-associated endonuclease Cas1 [Staphylococcus simulans]
MKRLYFEYSESIGDELKDIIYVKRYYFVTASKESFKLVNIIDKSESYIPFEDVDMFIFDHPRSYYSNQLIETCIMHNITIIFCNRKHQPITSIMSNYGHRKKLKRMIAQIKLQQKTKDRIWKKIITTKVKNQSDCLRYVARKEEEAIFLEEISKRVESGDKTNREAFAAKRYFNALFGVEFKRGRYHDAVNSGLNYGYALIRAKIQKTLANHGFEQAFGIHHCSTENPYNLSDDLIEVFRPFVDGLVYEFIYTQDVISLEQEHKEQLINIFFEHCIIDDKVYTVSDAIEMMVHSLIVCYQKNSISEFKIPSMIEEGP